MPSKKLEPKKYVVDTSVIIEEKISELIQSGKIAGKVIIPNAVLAELEHQANVNLNEGFIGLNEVKKLRELAEKKKIALEYFGDKPKEFQIKGARFGAIDDLIRDVAFKNHAILITGDKVQSLVAEAMGVESMLILPAPPKAQKLDIEKFFDKNTMSVHIKAGAIPVAKRGKPGEWTFVPLSKSTLDDHDVKTIASDAIEKTQMTSGSFVEFNVPGISIVQFKDYRIVICKPPFSDGWEVTAVKPIKTMEIEEYTLSTRLLNRLKTSATGILISGSPGSGKSTFASALAKYYESTKKIVKTIESPRDLQLPPQVTQYSKDFGNSKDIYNVLLLTRPDYTVFDEMRTTEDFKLYADLRLAGIGLMGVIHATEAIDAIQRFIGRLELGTIPHVVDTIIFIKNGIIGKCYELKMSVKVPTGMSEADLARPVIDVMDFETGDLEFEIYTYGEQTVVIPVSKKEKSPSERLIEEAIQIKLARKLSIPFKVEKLSEDKIALYVDQKEIPRVIGRQGENISELEQFIGLHIDVRELEGMSGEINYVLKEEKKWIVFYFKDKLRSVELYINDQKVADVMPGKKGQVMLHNKSKLGKAIKDGLEKGEKIQFFA